MSAGGSRGGEDGARKANGQARRNGCGGGSGYLQNRFITQIYYALTIFSYSIRKTNPRLIRAVEEAQATCKTGGANRLFRLPRFIPQAAGFRRAPVQIKAIEHDDLDHGGRGGD